jgi:hypothetical protein
VRDFAKIESTDPMRRQMNRGLMVTWINHALTTRSHLDVQKSIVIYDDDGLFLTACTQETWDAEGTAERAWGLGGRTWSTGIV